MRVPHRAHGYGLPRSRRRRRGFICGELRNGSGFGRLYIRIARTYPRDVKRGTAVPDDRQAASVVREVAVRCGQRARRDGDELELVRRGFGKNSKLRFGDAPAREGPGGDQFRLRDSVCVQAG